MGDPIADLDLNNDSGSLKELNSTLQTHNIGSNLDWVLNIIQFTPKPNQPKVRPARNYMEWVGKGRPGYNLEIVSENPEELAKYKENFLLAIIQGSDKSTIYDYDKTEIYLLSKGLI